jgi:hypothetical protein
VTGCINVAWVAFRSSILRMNDLAEEFPSISVPLFHDVFCSFYNNASTTHWWNGCGTVILLLFYSQCPWYLAPLRLLCYDSNVHYANVDVCLVSQAIISVRTCPERRYTRGFSWVRSLDKMKHYYGWGSRYMNFCMVGNVLIMYNAIHCCI